MRVDYSLPALQPETLAPDVSVPQTSRSFAELVRGETAGLPQTIEQQLRLDVRPFTGTYIGPPPSPRSMQFRDAETQRAHWRNMLWRHSSMADAMAGLNVASEQPVHTMLRMLSEMQDLEDSIVAQGVSLTRG